MTNHAPVILLMAWMLKTRIFLIHKILIFQIRKTLILKINIKQVNIFKSHTIITRSSQPKVPLLTRRSFFFKRSKWPEKNFFRLFN